jgi:hypothetical protein
LTDAPERASTAAGLDNGCRRTRDDRRQVPTPLISRFTLRGRRSLIRRDLDLLRGRYVDRSSGGYLAVILTLVILVVIDAGSTLYIVSHGGRELNPLMDKALRRGVGWFLLLKFTPLPVAFLLLSIHRYFRWVRAGLGFLVAVYGMLAMYHLFLLGRILAHKGQ